jgi:outer membrane protein assembly factor BamB
VQIFRPQAGIQALNPTNGHVLWTRHIPDISALTLADGVLYALTYSLGQPVRLIALHAGTGAPSAPSYSLGYYAFNAANSLMVANGEVFIRAVGPGGSKLVALELPG